MTKGATGAGMVRINARGEPVVSVVKRLIPTADGGTVVEAQISLERVPVPDRRYSADAMYVNYEGDGEAIHLSFAQKTLGDTKKLRSVVTVKVYPDHVRKFLSTTEKFTPQLFEYLQRAGAAVAELERLEDEPEHVVSLVANLVMVGFTAREAVIDFYHYNALAVMKLNSSSDLAVEPVVRVDLPSTLLAGMVRKLDNLLPQLPPELP